jgi:vacuolar-type H+-ATPase subunit F/Vma7
MADIAVLGDERSILGFKPFGVDVHFFAEGSGSNAGSYVSSTGSSAGSSAGSIEDWFKGIVRMNYKLILVTETVAEKLKEQIDALWFKDLPVVLTIRGVGESSRVAFERLRRLVIKAVGTDLFQET